MPIATRRTFVELGSGVLAAALTASARGAAPPASFPRLQSALLARPGVDEIMLDLIYDIRNNRQTVVDARQFFKEHQRQVMIATGVNDPLFPGSSVKPPADIAGDRVSPNRQRSLRARRPSCRDRVVRARVPGAVDAGLKSNEVT